MNIDLNDLKKKFPKKPAYDPFDDFCNPPPIKPFKPKPDPAIFEAEQRRHMREFERRRAQLLEKEEAEAKAKAKAEAEAKARAEAEAKAEAETKAEAEESDDSSVPDGSSGTDESSVPEDLPIPEDLQLGPIAQFLRDFEHNYWTFYDHWEIMRTFPDQTFTYGIIIGLVLLAKRFFKKGD